MQFKVEKIGVDPMSVSPDNLGWEPEPQGAGCL